jgi:maltoporin
VALAGASAPNVARAADAIIDYPTCSWGNCGYSVSENLALVNYGRLGLGYMPGAGQFARGKYMNLGDDRAIGGRLEESDYLLQLFVVHLYKVANARPYDIKTDVVFGFDAFANSFVSGWGGDRGGITLSPADAYVITHNILTPGLTVWVGSRLYRFQDIHINDYFYFNDNPGVGGGFAYNGLEFAILGHTGTSPFFQGTPGNPGLMPAPPNVQRMNTQVTAQYKLPLGKNNIQFLGEFQFVPALSTGTVSNPHLMPTGQVDPFDVGFVGGAKFHMDLDNGQFNDTSLRIGEGIANGAASGRRTWETFGLPNADGSYAGAIGLEFVDHFLLNFGDIATVNGYATAHYNTGARQNLMQANIPILAPAAVTAADGRIDLAVGARGTYYVTDQFHLNVEPTFQVRQDTRVCTMASPNCDGSRDMGTLLKLSAFASLVPNGRKGPYQYWGRPELRAVYIAGFYNGAAQDQFMSPYLQAYGKTTVAQYVGFQTEWWFGF